MKNFRKTFLLVFIITVLAFLPLTEQIQQVSLNASDELTAESVNQKADLSAQINEILSIEQLDGSIAGVSVRDAVTGEVLYDKNGDTRLHPASNMKLLTSTAALETLGKEYRFSTEVLTDGNQKGKVLHGNLYLKGKGDPTLLEKDLDQFAEDLKKQGIKKIKGDLIGDDTWYDDVRLSLDLNWSDEPYYTGAQVSALTLSPDTDYDAGTVIVEVLPADKEGEPAQVRMTPENEYITIVNKSKMVAADQSKDISIEREHGSNNIVIEGTMPIDGSASKSWSTVWEPTGYAVDVFKKSLEDEGIKFIGQSDTITASTPEKAKLLTSKHSMTLEELLVPFMKLSNNGHGEVLTKEMGKVVHGEGSWDKGIEVIEDTMTDLGVNPDTILLRDGSGMSHKNYIPANDLSQLLFAVQQKEWYPAFEYSLPVAGESERFTGGTLRSRMKEDPVKGNVLAKTGSLTSVSALSGYVHSQHGEKFIFSVMINNYLGSSGGIRDVEDRIATVLAKHEF